VLSVARGVPIAAARVPAPRSRPCSRIGVPAIAEGILFDAAALAFSATYVSTLVAFLPLAVGLFPVGRRGTVRPGVGQIAASRPVGVRRRTASAR
jgi:hypothetical protein